MSALPENALGAAANDPDAGQVALQPPTELPRAASEIEDAPARERAQRREHRVVLGSVDYALYERQVVDPRPQVEQRDVGHRGADVPPTRRA